MDCFFFCRLVSQLLNQSLKLCSAEPRLIRFFPALFFFYFAGPEAALNFPDTLHVNISNVFMLDIVIAIVLMPCM